MRSTHEIPPGIEPILIPLKAAFNVIGSGRTNGYKLVKQGRLKIIKLGRKSLASVSQARKLAQELIDAS